MAKKIDSKAGNLTISELTKSEILAVEMENQIARLERELSEQKSVVSAYKEREKVSARALVLCERKIKFLKNLIESQLTFACKDLKQEIDNIQAKLAQTGAEKAGEYESLQANLTKIYQTIGKLLAEIKENSSVDLESEDISPKFEGESLGDDINSRFNRLKKEFSEKIEAGVIKGRGRPKRGEQSLVSSLKLDRDAESELIKENKVNQKLSTIFYAVPKSENKHSNVPKTHDSVFDFDEALNPEMSLSDIMKDIMGEEKSTNSKQNSAKTNDDNLSNPSIVDENAKRRAQIERLESGFISFSSGRINTPKRSEGFGKVQEQKPEKKLTFEEKFLSLQDIMKSVK